MSFFLKLVTVLAVLVILGWLAGEVPVCYPLSITFACGSIFLQTEK